MSENTTISAPEAEMGAGNQPVKKKAVSRKEMSKLAWTLKEMKKNYVAYLMVAPFYIIFLLFTVVPVVLSLVLSFTSFNMLEWPTWVGMDNYTRLFLDDDIFILACQNTLIFASITGPVSYLLSFLVAWFINELPPKVRAFVTLIFYAPSISGSVYMIWQVAFSGDSYGYVNGILLKLGLITDPIQWFNNEGYVMPLCIIVALWTSLGTAFLSFIAGLQVVDRSLYEAGAVDGIKNRWQELWYVTLPYIKPQCGFPSVNYKAHTITHHLDDYGGQRYEIGYASAIATILFALMIGANMLVQKILSKVGQ